MNKNTSRRLKKFIEKKDLFYVKSIKKKKYLYKFLSPIKYFVSISNYKNNKISIDIKIKTVINVKCLTCLSFFSKKIISSSSIITTKSNVLKENSNSEKKIISIYRILQEELFYSLPFLPKHNLIFCKKIKN